MITTRLRVSSAPVSFGVDEVLSDDAWMPEPVPMLDWMADIGYEGTEMGPPGYLGDADEVRERLTSRGLALVGSFLPQHFSRAERAEEDRTWLRDQLRRIRAATPDGSEPLAILSDHFDERDRLAYAGRIREHPETWLSADRFETLIDNLHRAAELCREEGFEAVLHPHAATHIETADEIARVMDRMDGSLIGLCLDTGHFRFGGADPAKAVGDYWDLLRHVHIKDCRTSVLAEGRGIEDLLKRGVFCPLGEGDAGIPAVVDALRARGYNRWLVIEQDQALGTDDTPESVVAGQRANLEYLRGLGI
ncbi:MAG TPA: TIM barrel protein [Candidatus Limnocylindrales bacterium]|jgi:inosose dehydratase